LKFINKKVYILGTDKIGWSIDKDRMYTIEAINSIFGYEVTNSFIQADIIYAVWWNQLLSFKYKILLKVFQKKIVACFTNDLSHQKKELSSVLNSIDIFIYANSKQKEILIKNKILENQLYFNPFYVDENIFKKINMTQEDICSKFNINYEKIKNKKLIGSFQRDSLGSSLLKAKWQKNPDMLISIMKKLDKEKYMLVLAGPRRHYIIDKCRQFDIQYTFIGDESYIEKKKDDLLVNAISLNDMPYLYSLINLYIVSSSSEGGPKAIPESILCGTPLLSTDVGFARDLMNSENIYITANDAVSKIDKISLESQVDEYYSFLLFKERIEKILNGVNK
jgi:glycosyltransferase involved in cell wall biosynthesis